MTTVIRKETPTMPAKLADVAPFPAVAMKLLTVLGGDTCSFSSIAACIGTDAALSARLIRRANAADLRTYCEVTTVLQAVTALGMDRTRDLALTLVTSDYARSIMKREIDRQCWRHTLACALCAAEVARQSGLRATQVYTAALLHDIGRLGLICAYPDDYEAVIAKAQGHPENLIAFERERFGVDHMQAGEYLARRWDLPPSLQEAIARHHEKREKTLDQLGIVQTACHLADLLGFGMINPAQPLEVQEIVAALPDWNSTAFQAGLPALRKAIVREIQLFEGESDEETEAQPQSAEDPAIQLAAEIAVAGPRSASALITGAVTIGVLVLAGAIAYLFRN